MYICSQTKYFFSQNYLSLLTTSPSYIAAGSIVALIAILRRKKNSFSYNKVEMTFKTYIIDVKLVNVECSMLFAVSNFRNLVNGKAYVGLGDRHFYW